MKIDPKYFNTFLLIVAVIAAGIIAYVTFQSRSSERAAFRERMVGQDSLRTVYWPVIEGDDSLRVSDLRGKVVVLDFWSNWSDASLQSHRELAKLRKAYPDSLEVIAAAVGLRKEEAISYIEKWDFPFRFVAGSRHFSAFGIPGLPAQIIFDPNSELSQVYLGYRNDSRYDSLRQYLTHGKK